MEGDWAGVFPFSTQYVPIKPGVYLRTFAGLIWFTQLDVGWNEIAFGQTVAQLEGGTVSLSYAKVRDGGRFPALTASIQTMFNGDTVILSTDGIRAGFDEGLNLRSTPQQVADSIFALKRRENNDALVLVTCYLGI